MDKNEIKTVGTVDEVIALINGEVDDDPDARKVLKAARLLCLIGVLVIDNWDEMKHYFPEDVQDQVDDTIGLFIDYEQPNDNEE